MYTLRICSSINEIDANDWDKIANNILPRTHAFLSAIEESDINDCKYFYPVIFNKNNEIVAHTCIYTITTDLAMVISMGTLFKKCVTAIRKIFPNFLQIIMTECGTPVAVGIGHTISIKPDEDTAEICRHVSTATDLIAKKHKSKFIAIRDFIGQERQIFDVFMQNNFIIIKSVPTAILKIHWNNFNDYMASMKSKYRYAINKKLAKCKNVIVELVTDFDPLAEILSKQVNNVFQNAELKREILTPKFYTNIYNRLGRSSTVLVAKINHEPVAHALLLTDNKQTVFAYYGKSKPERNFVYFKVLNEIVAFAISKGSEFLNLGVSTYQAKQLFGAKLEPTYVYFKHQNSIIRFILKKFSAFLTRKITDLTDS